MNDLDSWKTLLMPQGSRLLEQCQSLDLTAASSIQRLRRDNPPDVVSAAIELTLARINAKTKFGDQATTLIADRQGVQMASTPEAAAHKAARFAQKAPNQPVLDLCSGIGADAMALRDASILVTAYDLDPVRAWMTTQNAGCPTIAVDVTQTDLPPGFIHIDPQRRHHSERRIPKLDDLQPSFDWIQSLIDQRPGVCVKLFPGVPFDALPPGEIELFSQRGRLTQALLWTGLLATNERAATSLTAGETIAGSPGPAPMGPVSEFIHAIDPAVERADLIGLLAQQFALTTPHPASGLLTGTSPIQSSLLTSFKLIAELPWAPKKVRRALRELDGGIIEVKTRGQIIDPDRIQRDMRGSGPEHLTLFVLRFGDRIRALIAKRIDKSTLTVP
jgi:THUMP domain-containing protein